MPEFRNFIMKTMTDGEENPEEVYSMVIRNENIPTNLDIYVNLSSITFINCVIEELPLALRQLSKLRLKSCNIVYPRTLENVKRKAPDEIGLLKYLEGLTLSGFKILPESLGNLHSLISFHSYDGIPETLPAYLFELPNINRIVFDTDKLSVYEGPTKEWVDMSISKVYECCKFSKIYTYKGNEILNMTMRNGTIPQFMYPVYKSLIEGQVTSPSLTLYRGINYEYVQNLNIGDIIYDNSFTSFTFDPNVAMTFSQDPPTLLILNDIVNGTYLGDDKVSYFRGEKEFIIGPQTSFKIINIEYSFIEYLPGSYKKVNKYFIEINNADPVQTLTVSDDLENTIMAMVSSNTIFTNTKAHTYDNKEVLRQLINNQNKPNIDIIHKRQYKELYSFIIDYLRNGFV